MSRKKPTVPCAAITPDKSRCGRRVPAGTVPPLCHLHDPNYVATGVIKEQDTDDPVVLYKRLMKDRDPAIRLRALTAFLDYSAKRGCPACADREKDATRRTDALSRMTPEQFTECRALLEQVRTLVTLATDQAVRTAPLQRTYPEYQPAPLQAATQESPNAPVIEHSSVPDAPEAARQEVTRYADVGLFVTKSGVVSHDLGDDHAAKILSGAISFQDALDAETAAKAKARRMNHITPWSPK